MRTMDQILAKDTGTEKPAADTAGLVAEPVERAEAKPTGSETPPKEAKAPTPKLESKPEPQEEEPEAEHVPDDLDGLKKALAASRGDKRKARKKWQEVERLLAEANGRLSVYQQNGRQQASPEPAPQPKPETIDLTEENFFGKGPEAVKAYVDHKMQAIESKAQQKYLARSERAAQRRHEDYGEAFAAFEVAAKNQPGLVAQMLEDDDPAEYAYQAGKTYLQVKDVGSLDDLRKQIEAEVRAKIAAEQPSTPVAKPPIPRSLAGARGNGIGTPAAWNGPRSMEDILR